MAILMHPRLTIALATMPGPCPQGPQSRLNAGFAVSGTCLLKATGHAQALCQPRSYQLQSAALPSLQAGQGGAGEELPA